LLIIRDLMICSIFKTRKKTLSFYGRKDKKLICNIEWKKVKNERKK